jgi:hypothetical protein
MWNAWIGFNASHSAGAMFMGLINIILVVQYYSIIQYGVLIHSLNLVTAIFYCWLGKRYWFRIPFIGISISTCCFLAVALLTWFSAQ